MKSLHTHRPLTASKRDKRDIVMMEYLSLVKIIAKKMANRLPASIEVDDLISAGLIGLMQAQERYNPERGFKFKTYAEFRIRGAMLDELRSQDWCPKGMRQKAKQFSRICDKIKSKKGRDATDKELRQALHLTKGKYNQLVRDVNTLEQMNLASYVRIDDDDSKGACGIDLVADTNSTSNPMAEASRHDTQATIEQALHQLPEVERTVLMLYYFEELNLKEIGKQLHLSDSRVCQLRSQAINKLKQYVNSEQVETQVAA